MDGELNPRSAFWNKQTIAALVLGLVGWTLLADSFVHFIPWPTIPAILEGDWPWWGLILGVAIGVPLSLVLAVIGWGAFAVFLNHICYITRFVPSWISERFADHRSNRERRKLLERVGWACVLWYLPWILSALNSVGHRLGE